MFEAEKMQASRWFKTLRDEIVSAFEQVEEGHVGAPFQIKQEAFLIKKLGTADDGSDAGGGIMSVMRNGRVFERLVSTCLLCMGT